MTQQEFESRIAGTVTFNKPETETKNKLTMAEKLSTKDYLSLSYEEKIDIMINTPEVIDLPEEASYVAQYIERYRPIIPPEAHIDNESSIDIQDTLQSVCLIDTKVISRVMKMLGYRLHFQGVASPNWAMKHLDSK